MKLAFTKMQGCANDYIYLDCRSTGLPDNIAELSRKLSARRFSIGGDGIICICAPQSPDADATMRIFNADGSEGMMCGNGIRCVAEWLYTHEPACAGKDQLRIDTRSGQKLIRHQGEGLWQVEMGRYSAMAADLPAVNMGEGPLVRCTLDAAGQSWQVTCISVGNPHCVTVVEDVDALNLEAIGPSFEKHPNFPQQVNTEFIQKLDDHHLKMRVWERGSGGNLGLRHRCLRLGGCADRAGHGPGGGGYPRPAAGRRTDHPGAGRPAAADDRPGCHRLRGHNRSIIIEREKTNHEDESALQRAEGKLPVCGHQPPGGRLPAGPPRP